MQKIYLFIFIIFFLNIGNCVDLRLSPSQLDFEGKAHEKICKNLTIKVGQDSEVIGKTLWAKENITQRKLSLHKDGPEERGLEVFFEEQIELNDKKTIPVCIEGKIPGNYHGAILYKIKDKPVQVGIWLNLTLEEKEGIITITGNTIQEKTNENRFVGIAIILVIIFLSLFVISKTGKK